jgi:UDP-GlcNAc:undecaprenyl-phosphate GlcNAc-1-phosphate transferase
VLAVPFVDLVLAVVRRTRAGQSPFSPDKRHLHHRLLEIGHSQTRAVVIMYFWTALIAFTGVAVSLAGAGMVLGVAGAIAVVGLLALNLPRIRHQRS